MWKAKEVQKDKKNKAIFIKIKELSKEMEILFKI